MITLGGDSFALAGEAGLRMDRREVGALARELIDRARRSAGGAP